jgi:hypothetical protein
VLLLLLLLLLLLWLMLLRRCAALPCSCSCCCCDRVAPPHCAVLAVTRCNAQRRGCCRRDCVLALVPAEHGHVCCCVVVQRVLRRAQWC